MKLNTGKWVALAIGLMTFSALAAPLSPGDHDFIQNEQSQRLQQNQDQRDALWHAATPESRPVPQPNQNGPCFTVRHILIKNSTLISEKQKRTFIRPYINRCLNLTEINALVHAISDWYMQRGYITSRAFLTEQGSHAGRTGYSGAGRQAGQHSSGWCTYAHFKNDLSGNGRGNSEPAGY